MPHPCPPTMAHSCRSRGSAQTTEGRDYCLVPLGWLPGCLGCLHSQDQGPFHLSPYIEVNRQYFLSVTCLCLYLEKRGLLEIETTAKIFKSYTHKYDLICALEVKSITHGNRDHGNRDRFYKAVSSAHRAQKGRSWGFPQLLSLKLSSAQTRVKYMY